MFGLSHDSVPIMISAFILVDISAKSAFLFATHWLFITKIVVGVSHLFLFSAYVFLNSSWIIMYISRSRLTLWKSAKEHCHMKGDNLPSFITSSDVKTLGFFVKNKILPAGWQSIADMMYIGYQREQVGISHLFSKCFYFYDNTIIAWHNNNYIRQQDYIHV